SAALMHTLAQAREEREHAREIGLEMRRVGDGGAHLQIFEHGHAHEDTPALRRLRDLQPRYLVGRKLRDVAAGERDGARARARLAGGGGWPQIVIISVDLPAPLAPIRVTISPSPTSTSTPLRAAMLP